MGVVNNKYFLGLIYDRDQINNLWIRWKQSYWDIEEIYFMNKKKRYKYISFLRAI